MQTVFLANILKLGIIEFEILSVPELVLHKYLTAKISIFLNFIVFLAHSTKTSLIRNIVLSSKSVQISIILSFYDVK